MRTANPALNPKLFEREGRATVPGETMTAQGTANKTGVLLLLLVVPAFWIWNKFSSLPLEELGSAAMPWMFGGMIVGFILAMVTIFKKTVAGVTAPLYALAQGVFLGAISLVFEASFPGIVLQAVGLTLGVMFVMLGLYKSGVIKVTAKLRMAIVAATGGIALLYIASIVLGFFGVGIPLIHGSGTFGILFSLFVVGVAAFNLVLDFDFVDRASAAGFPKYMEWYGAFGLIVTLVWLYLELLRLLSKLNSRR